MITPMAPPDNLVTTFPKTEALIPMSPPKIIPKPDNISPQANAGAIAFADGTPCEANHPTKPSLIGIFPYQ